MFLNLSPREFWQILSSPKRDLTSHKYFRRSEFYLKLFPHKIVFTLAKKQTKQKKKHVTDIDKAVWTLNSVHQMFTDGKQETVTYYPEPQYLL